ncbi:hypothetical protein Glove_414g12 [Diversispora epigaea]|uniref:Uncharacterized protein n=1 Tax=Diversispora epigaea TaxID=1348612 RepID=A0A397GX31_9GLOM|nr:hypothetical protein Glove_414g12 [Diversispora epigaea]
MHIFTCKQKGDLDPIKDLTNKFKEILTKKIKKEEFNIDIKIIKKAINEIDILNYSYEKDYTLSKNYSDLSFFDIIKGFIPNNLVTNVKKIYRNKKVKANKIIIDVLEEFQKIIIQTWKERFEEDNMHIFTCKQKGDLDPIKDLTNKFKEILTKKIKKEEFNIDIKIIKKAINEIDILNYSYEKDYTLSKNYSDLSFFDIIKGFIPNILVTNVKKIYRNKKVKANKIIIDVLEEFQKIIIQTWKERCDKVIEWEIKNGITNNDKRIKQIWNEVGVKISVDKVPNTRKGNLYTSKTIVEKTWPSVPKLNNLGNDGPDGKSSIAYFSQFQ